MSVDWLQGNQKCFLNPRIHMDFPADLKKSFKEGRISSTPFLQSLGYKLVNALRSRRFTVAMLQPLLGWSVPTCTWHPR